MITKETILEAASKQEAIAKAKAAAKDSKFTPNVAMVRAEGVRMVSNSIIRQVRTELMKAVKSGDLGHLKKDRNKKEIFFHPDKRKEALKKRDDAEKAMAAAVGKVTR